jgi:4'-phosphopantetheinyl transferase
MDGVEIIYFNLEYHNSKKTSILKWLSSDEHDRAARFICPVARHQYIICRAYLRALLTDKLNCHPADVILQISPYGKPYALICGEVIPLAFNVSHSGAYGVIALSLVGDIGVDIQVYRQEIDLMQIATSFFNTVEINYLENCHKLERIELFYRIWTLKEAIVKSLGRGLYIDSSSFSLPENILRNSVHANLKWIDASVAGKISNLHLRIIPFSEDAALAFAVKALNSDHGVL